MIQINLHPENSYSAEIIDHGYFHVLKLKDKNRGVEIAVYGGSHNTGHGEALKMIADIFNDAFSKPPVVAILPSVDLNDDLPF